MVKKFRGDENVQQLRNILQIAYDNISEAVDVSPSLLATTALVELDPDKRTPALVYMAAHLELRQIGRSICREWFEKEEEPDEAHSLFPDLQNRYPAAHAEDVEPMYRLLEHLTEDDVMFNVNRLRREAAAKMKHADALEAWWLDRQAKQASA